jgi:hypothetical protein
LRTACVADCPPGHGAVHDRPVGVPPPPPRPGPFLDDRPTVHTKDHCGRVVPAVSALQSEKNPVRILHLLGSRAGPHSSRRMREESRSHRRTAGPSLDLSRKASRILQRSRLGVVVCEIFPGFRAITRWRLAGTLRLRNLSRRAPGPGWRIIWGGPSLSALEPGGRPHPIPGAPLDLGQLPGRFVTRESARVPLLLRCHVLRSSRSVMFLPRTRS